MASLSWLDCQHWFHRQKLIAPLKHSGNYSIKINSAYQDLFRFKCFYWFVLVIEDDHKYIQILGADGAAPWYGHMETVIELSYDGFEDTPYYSCFITNLTRNGWATYYISFSSVDQLIFLNRDGPSKKSDIFEKFRVCDMTSHFSRRLILSIVIRVLNNHRSSCILDVDISMVREHCNAIVSVVKASIFQDVYPSFT